MAAAPPTVALIHASEASMAPAAQAFATEFPEAQLWHLLDSRLVSDADRAGGITPELHARMTALIEYAVRGGADAVQLSCSMYGPVGADAAAVQPVIVLASDQAMFERVVLLAPARVGVLGSLGSAVSDSATRLRDSLATAGVDATVVERVVTGAADAANAGRLEDLEALMVAAATEMSGQVDLIVLAQYSLAPTVAAVQAAVPLPVLSPPHLAAATLAGTVGRTAR